MNRQPVLRTWYQSAHSGDSRPLIEIAFDDAKAKFADEKGGNGEATCSATSLQDVLDTVSKSMEEYQSRRKESKAWKWLRRLSHRLHFYSGVLDVLAQHHPEYVALVWGAMKFLIIAVINHEKVLATLAKAISQLAETLPRVELKSYLYPTPRMQAAVTDLYMCILSFLVRARDWYTEGKLRHFVHSITRPIELQYNDILEQIAFNSHIIDQLATSGQLAEFRDMHDKIHDMNVKMERIVTTMTLNSSALIDTNQRLSDLQFSQIMGSLSGVPLWDPAKVYQYHQSLRHRRSQMASIRSMPNSFWQSPKLRYWSSTTDSTLSIIVGNFHSRFIMRNLCVDIIQQLREAKVPVLLALRVPQENGTSASASSSDLLKYLVRQAIQLKQKLQTEKSMALKCATFHEASTETEWFQVLESILAQIDGQIYLILDLEILDRRFDTDEFSWVKAFEQFFRTLLSRGLSTKVKVLLVSYRVLPISLSTSEQSKFVISAKTQLTTARQRRAGRGNKSPQVPFRVRSIAGSIEKRQRPGIKTR